MDADRALEQLITTHLDQRGLPTSLESHKLRGAYFTPADIAMFLTSWAVAANPKALVLDPMCGDGVFLEAAGIQLREIGVQTSSLDAQVFGVDVHAPSLDAIGPRLDREGLDAHLTRSDFFDLDTPDGLLSTLPSFDAVVGNPPFVRYQDHTGKARGRSLAAALRQGVRLSKLSSSWAPALVHASAFLKPDGRLGMVLPAELLTVGYAEPIRRWLRSRFAAVRLILFDNLQFDGAQENVVLLLANGSGGCDSFSIYQVSDAADLSGSPFTEVGFTPANQGKWTEAYLTPSERQLFRRVTDEWFEPLSQVGRVELGSVTGANDFFTLSDSTVERWRLEPSDVRPICPAGTRHLKGLRFELGDWRRLESAGERAFVFQPPVDAPSAGARRYIAFGESIGVDQAYKCKIRSPWWRPPVLAAPDLYFTYMSHHIPRLIANTARTPMLNTMHGVTILGNRRERVRLPVLSFNSITALGAELHGRSYGGGLLKMEPSEASVLPIPNETGRERGWKVLSREVPLIERYMRTGLWTTALTHVDRLLLENCFGLHPTDVETLMTAARRLREARTTRGHRKVAPRE